jgi:energy-converting hydrogenase Eha subunit A
MAASDILPLIHGSDVAEVAGAVLQIFDKYVNKVFLMLLG